MGLLKIINYFDDVDTDPLRIFEKGGDKKSDAKTKDEKLKGDRK